MNLISRLNYTNAKLKRKLFDNKIKLQGFEVQCIRVTITEDRFSNRDYAIENHGLIEMILDIPSKEIFMGNSSRINNDAYEQFASLYQLLPITGYPKNDALLEQGDLILFKYLLDPLDQTNSSQKNYLQALQVSAPYGRFSNTLMYRYYHLAPYTFNTDVEPELAQLISQYELTPITI